MTGCMVYLCNEDGRWGRAIVESLVVNVCLCPRHEAMAPAVSEEDISRAFDAQFVRPLTDKKPAGIPVSELED